eukprot:403363344
MKDMSQDFVDMKEAREESKRKLEQRFSNAYNEIEENKRFTISQMEMVHETLNEFQASFLNELDELGQNLKNQINEEGQFVRAQWAQNHQRMDQLENMIIKEREDRIKYHDDYLNPIRSQVKTIQEGLIKEKKTRITNEKAILKQIANESTNMQNDIQEESVNRQEKMQDLDDFITQDTDLTSKFLENFEKNAINEADKFMDDLEKEMDSRFDHQNNMLDNMSRFVGKFQETLKIFGKDV